MEITPDRSMRKRKPVDYSDRKPPPKKKQGDEEFPIGFRIKKSFKGVYFEGHVTEPPRDDNGIIYWRVVYSDGDWEELERDELNELRADDSAVELVDDDEDEAPETAKRDKKKSANSKSRKKGGTKHVDDYETALTDLKYKIGITHEEAQAALKKMTPPYGMNEAIRLIHRARNSEESYVNREKFCPGVGMRIRKYYDGAAYHGVVINDGEFCDDPETGEQVKMWKVKYDDDGDTEDMDFFELQRHYAGRPIRSHPVRGRELCALELFCGCNIVSQEFAEHKWRVRSIDNCPKSYATDQVDIMKLKYEDIGFVPDFIWASPPCFTYSNMAGGTHRKNLPGKYEITPAARENNRYLAQTYAIMRWARSKNPHLIVVIENPVGLMQKMPLMDEIRSAFGLEYTIVHYCAFGRDDKKPTLLFTNDDGLRCNLLDYTCEKKCPYHGGIHPVGARALGHQYNAAAIPNALAEEVADEVSARFQAMRIRRKPQPTMTEEEIDEFNKLMARGSKEEEEQQQGEEERESS